MLFRPSKFLDEVLKAEPRDIYDIVGALIGYIDADPLFRTKDFDEALEYVFTHGIGKSELFEEFDPDLDFVADKTAWNEEYYSLARVYLKDNFCEKRINHVKEIAHALYGQDIVQREKIDESSIDTQDMGGQQLPEKKLDTSQGKKTTPQSVTTKTAYILLVVIIIIVIVCITK